MNNEEILTVGLDQAGSKIGQMGYKDDGIAIFTDIRDLPFEEKQSIRLDMVAIVACAKGKIQVDINAKTYMIRRNEVVICKPNDVISEFMVSPDFNGAILFMSDRYLFEQISESTIWDNALRILKSPVMKVREENLNSYLLYEEILQTKIKQERTPFRKEIISSILKAALYELLSDFVADTCNIPDHKLQLEKASDVLFKKFIELITGNKIKPRSVAWYANKLCVTPKYLSSVSKQVSGRTAFDWINEYVQIDIRHWLKNSSRTIKEVADILGFPNISFFGKYCRAHFGMSPTELRKSLRHD